MEEYGSFQIESTPNRPFLDDFEELNSIVRDMRHRRRVGYWNIGSYNLCVFAGHSFQLRPELYNRLYNNWEYLEIFKIVSISIINPRLL